MGVGSGVEDAVEDVSSIGLMSGASGETTGVLDVALADVEGSLKLRLGVDEVGLARG